MTSFIYTQNVPNPPNFPSEDVGSMQTNTNSIFSWTNVDHFGVAQSGALQIDGRHMQVSLVNQAAPAIPANIGGVLFANNPAPTNVSWPFWENTTGVFQLLGQSLFATNGFVQLGGFIVQWGVVNGTHGGGKFNDGDTGTVTFATANMPFPNNCFGVQFSGGFSSNITAPNGYGNAVYDQIPLSKTSFNWKFFSNSGQYTQFFWLAVGN